MRSAPKQKRTIGENSIVQTFLPSLVCFALTSIPEFGFRRNNLSADGIKHKFLEGHLSLAMRQLFLMPTSISDNPLIDNFGEPSLYQVSRSWALSLFRLLWLGFLYSAILAPLHRSSALFHRHTLVHQSVTGRQFVAYNLAQSFPFRHPFSHLVFDKVFMKAVSATSLI